MDVTCDLRTEVQEVILSESTVLSLCAWQFEPLIGCGWVRGGPRSRSRYY